MAPHLRRLAVQEVGRRGLVGRVAGGAVAEEGAQGGLGKARRQSLGLRRLRTRSARSPAQGVEHRLGHAGRIGWIRRGRGPELREERRDERRPAEGPVREGVALPGRRASDHGVDRAVRGGEVGEEGELGAAVQGRGPGVVPGEIEALDRVAVGPPGP